MKNRLQKISKRNRNIYLFSILALFIGVIACEIPEDAGSVLEIRAETNIFSHKGFITVNDLVDQNNLSGNILKAKITVLNDTRSNLIVSEGGDFGDTIDIIDGFAAFAVNPSYRDFTSPIDVQIEIYGNDYLSKTTTVTINPEDFTTEINETVLKINDVPNGVGVKLQNENLTGGSNTNIISITTDDSSEGTSADVNIPADNGFKDANGNDINSGDLSLQVVYFDGNDVDASRASNNGNVASLVDEDGNTSTNVVLVPLATVDINMFVGGVEVKEFDIPIEIVMDVNEEMINPNTGVKVAVGDEINVYTTSDDSNWSFLIKEVIKSSGGKLIISFTTDHLSTFSAAFKENTCDDGRAILTLPNDGEGFAPVYMGAFFTENNAVIPTVAIKIDSKLYIGNAPNGNASLVLEPFFSTGNSVTIDDIAWCGDNNEVNEEEANEMKPDGVTVNLNISAKCPSGKSAIIPNEVKVFVDYNGTGYFKPVGTIKDGKIAIPGIELNKSYEMKVTYDGQSGYGSYTFTSASMDILDYDLPGDVCTQLNL